MVRISSTQYAQVIQPPEVQLNLLKQKCVRGYRGQGDRKTLADGFKRVLQEAEALKNPKLAAEASICYKWLQHTTFPSELIQSDFASVKFLVNNGLIHTIMLYNASSDMLEGDPATVQCTNGKAEILQKGAWVPVERIRNTIKEVFVDGKFEKFENWTYTHPRGFIRQDRFNWKDIRQFPIAKLNKAAHDTIKEKSGVKDTPYILQPIVTDEGQTKNFSLLKNFARFNGVHAHAIIIDPEGQVFSVGTMLEGDEMKRLQSGYGAFTAATANAKLNGPDYDLARINCVHHTTYLPMTTEQAERTFTYINSTNAGNAGLGMRFNMLRQNCARFLQGVMKEAGYEVESHVPAKELIKSMLPNIEHIPLVGAPLSAISERVGQVTKPIFDAAKATWARAPSPVWMKRFYSQLKSAVWYVPNKLSTFVISTAAVIFLGGSRGVSFSENTKKESPHNQERMTTFKALFESFKDLFDETRTTAYLPFKIAEWMKDKHTSAYVAFDNRVKAMLPIHSPIHFSHGEHDVESLNLKKKKKS